MSKRSPTLLPASACHKTFSKNDKSFAAGWSRNVLKLPEKWFKHLFITHYILLICFKKIFEVSSKHIIKNFSQTMYTDPVSFWKKQTYHPRQRNTTQFVWTANKLCYSQKTLRRKKLVQFLKTFQCSSETYFLRRWSFRATVRLLYYYYYCTVEAMRSTGRAVNIRRRMR